MRFYRAVTRPARFGAPGEYGHSYSFKFRADNLREARHHAEHCLIGDPLGRAIDYVQFIGTDEPQNMGVFVKYGRDE